MLFHGLAEPLVQLLAGVMVGSTDATKASSQLFTRADPLLMMTTLPPGFVQWCSVLEMSGQPIYLLLYQAEETFSYNPYMTGSLPLCIPPNPTIMLAH